MYQFERSLSTIDKINGFIALSAGWHYGDGKPPSIATVSSAQSMNNFFVQVGFTMTDAFPGIDGEVMVTAYSGTLYVECVVESNGTYSIVGELNRFEMISATGMSEDDVLGTIAALRESLDRENFKYD